MQASLGSAKDRLVATGSALRGGGRGWVLLVVAAGWLTVLGGRYLFPEILPAIREFFDVSNATAGLAITVVWGSYALMQFPAGMLTDHFGERTLLATSLVVSAGAVGAVALAPTFALFVVGCALFGFGTGLYGPARGIVLSETFGDHDGAAIGATLAAGSIGSASIPFVANALVGPLGWQTTVTLLVVPFLVVAGGVWWAVPRRTPPTNSDGRRSVGAVVAALRSAVTRRSIVAVSATTLMLFVLQGLTSFLPSYLVGVKDLSGAAAAGLFALFFLSGAVFQSLAGNAVDRYGHRTVGLAIAICSVLPLLALPFVDGLVPLSVLVVVLGVRLAINPVNNAYIIAAVPNAVQGTAWGFFRTVFFVLAATGSTVVGLFFDADLQGVAFVGLAVITALAAGCYAYLPSLESV